ncbi:MAG: homoserine kinase [Melioribacteraceae bacterium]|nr:homoserine kinase [Melioribacteraceae bacterium]
MKNIKIFAPASISNVGPGFDIMGFALYKPGDEIMVKLDNHKKIVISKITGDGKKLPLNPEKNTATVAIKSLLDAYNIKIGLSVSIKKRMGIGSGLGSSAASAVGGVYAVNKLLGLNLRREELLYHAMAGEYIASQAYHADNVAPALYGGFVLIRSYDPLDIIKIKTRNKLFCSVLYPDIEIRTSEARKIIKNKIPIKKAVAQAGNSAGVITGLVTGDNKLLGRSMIDHFAEPYRKFLIPGYDIIRESALAEGAINCNITGSGPSMFSFCESEDKAYSIAEAMKKASAKFTSRNKTYISRINEKGPIVL